jgi:uncharacterized protein
VIVVDVNLLLYAVITSFPRHAQARRWWEHVINTAPEIGLAAPALFGFLRICTNPRVLESPLRVEAALGYVRDWLDQPNVRFLLPGPNYLEIAFGMLSSAGTGRNLTTDVQLAAHAVEHDAELHSNDTDFGRFAGLRWVNPMD